MLQITSPQNQKIKDCLRLRNSQSRREQQLFLIEGARELGRAIRSGYRCRTLFVCPQVLSDEARSLVKILSDVAIEVAEPVFQKLAVRDHSDGLLAVMENRKWELSSLETEKSSPYLVLENVEKPGNFGALARTADAVGASALIVLDENADLFNPIAVRASVGAIFSLPLVACSHRTFLEFCEKRQLGIVTASPAATRYHYEEDLKKPFALVLGSEAEGLSAAWSGVKHAAVKIPMLGIADSLNVSVAGAVILYESLRQRGLRASPI